MKLFSTFVAAALFTGTSFGGTSSVDFIECKDNDFTTAKLTIETDIEETVAISLDGELYLKDQIWINNFTTAVTGTRWIAAGGGGYQFIVGPTSSFTAWPEEVGSSLHVKLGNNNYFYQNCELNQEKVSELVGTPEGF